MIWIYDLVAVAVLFFLGLACLVSMRNMIKLIIGVEIVAKGVTLALITSGFAKGNPNLTQAIFITFIVIEVVIVAIALAIIINIYKHTNSLDIRRLTKLRW